MFMAFFFLPTEAAGKAALGSKFIILDAAPHHYSCKTAYVASVINLHPKKPLKRIMTIKLMFRVNSLPELLEKHLEYVKTGLPGRIFLDNNNLVV